MRTRIEAWLLGVGVFAVASGCQAPAGTGGPFMTGTQRPAPVVVPVPASGSTAAAGGSPGTAAGGSPREAVVFQSLLDAAVDKNKGYGGGVLRIESLSGSLVWEGASGAQARGGPPMGVGDTFEVASITKTLVATLVLELSEEGRLDIDFPLSVIAPGLAEGLLVVGGEDLGPRITPRQLLAQTSGLADVWSDRDRGGGLPNAFIRAFDADPNRFWRPEEVLSYARGLAPFAAPGQRYHYSDTGYVLLGLLVERLTGKPLHALLREHIFLPLRMQDTSMSYREPPSPGWVEAHRYEGRLDLYGQRRQSADWSSGGLVSSTRDMARFFAALARGALFEHPATLDAMRAWGSTGTPDVAYGLGLFCVALDQGEGELWGHDGHGNAFAYVWPERGLVFTGTLNQTDNDWWPLVWSVIQEIDGNSPPVAGDGAARDGGSAQVPRGP